jgi:hypothetical protein
MPKYSLVYLMKDIGSYRLENINIGEILPERDEDGFDACKFARIRIYSLVVLDLRKGFAN